MSCVLWQKITYRPGKASTIKVKCDATKLQISLWKAWSGIQSIHDTWQSTKALVSDWKPCYLGLNV